jgi:hypothetical protein
MAKEKLTLDSLKVESFVTTLSQDQMTNTKGGIYHIRGRRYTYRSRWTAIDTRSDVEDTAASSNSIR